MSDIIYSKYLNLVNTIIYSKGIEINSEWDIMNLKNDLENEDSLLEIQKKYLNSKLNNYISNLYKHYPVWRLNNCFRTSLAYRDTTSFILKMSNEDKKVKWLNKIYNSLINDCINGIRSTSFAGTIAFYLLAGTNTRSEVYEKLNNLYNNSVELTEEIK